MLCDNGDVGGDGRELGEPVAGEDSRFETAAGAWGTFGSVLQELYTEYTK